MYHLLLVDDEDLTVERLRSAIDWPSLGISQVFSAFSMQQAQKLFLSERIDVMVCDIEMPAGSGIELLRWVREQGYPAINIFLTGHADFSYAKDALSLQTLEYILKPVSFEEVEQAVRRAVAQLRARQEEEENYRTHFFRRLIQGEIMPNPDSIQRSAQKSGLTFSASSACIPALLASKDHFIKKGTAGGWDASPAVRNIIEETVHPLLCRPLSFSGNLLLLFPDSLSQAEAAQHCHAVLDAVSCSLSLRLLFCLGEKVLLTELKDHVNRLAHEEREIVQESGVFLLDAAQKPLRASTGAKPNYALWRTMLEQGDPDGVTRHIRAYLDSLSRVDRETLCRFYDGYWQMAYTLLNAHDIPTHFLGSSYPDEVTHSLPRLIEWVEAVNRELCDCLKNGETGAVVDRAKAFIEEHIQGPISRNQVAESVHLTPEYLSRVFRKETGRSLIEYITDVKMEAAQELLTHSDLPVSQIAAQLGYGNFAYFSQLFRARLRESPSDYRKLYRKQRS